MTIKTPSLQSVTALAAIVMAVLTQSFPSIHLPAIASGVLGLFGILLHPQTSITTSEPSQPSVPS